MAASATGRLSGSYGIRKIIVLFVLIQSKSVLLACPTDTLFLGSVSEADPEFVSRTGIYRRQVDAENDNRPVYKHTLHAYYLYFIQSNGLFRGYWVVGTEIGTTNISLGVEGDALTPDKVSSPWQMWDPNSQSWSPSEKLRAICVDDAFSSCSSGQLRMLRSYISGSYFAQQRRMGIYDITSGINELRPVYKQRGYNEYLFYTSELGGHWVVGPEVGKWAGGMFVSDRAWRPEFIFGKWIVFAGPPRNYLFEDNSGIHVRCEGFTFEGKEDDTTTVSESESVTGNTDEPETTFQEAEVNNPDLDPSIPIRRARDSGVMSSFLESRRLPWNKHSRPKQEKKDLDSSTCQRSDADPEVQDVSCLNGGRCRTTERDGDTFYLCICEGGFFGKDCKTEITCNEPPDVSDLLLTAVDSTGHHFLDVVLYRCEHADQVLSGPPGVVCQMDGTWSEPPTCDQSHNFAAAQEYDDYSIREPDLRGP